MASMMGTPATTRSLHDRLKHSINRTALRSYLAEFISTFLFVFVVIGSIMASRELLPDGTITSDPSCLVAVAFANAFALSTAVYIFGASSSSDAKSASSGAHVNPAVTFGLAVGGHISIPTALFYWIMQLLASSMACLFLRVATADHVVPTHAIAVEMTGFGASIIEGVTTFTLVYTIYAARDARKGPLSAIGPIAIGFVAGGNVLATGPFSGGSMNPACSFGSALVNGSFKNQAVYWVGPLIGGAIAGLVYDNVVFPVTFVQHSAVDSGINDGHGTNSNSGF
ncbi:probable aquaporin TIP5-1 [Papaver somniferum]|uniref:probable aquaporin TIP5-1 n=1 Tax=Papaver somniferum TaxID=3469 RepID=UPI000E6FB246|nr:probable aquaporin TIP5-1 [Papaver somniferum]